MVKIGVISDTHGYFHPRLPIVFEGAALILHAGDVGRLDVIRRLESIAPVLAVRGNVDGGLSAPHFPLRRLVWVEQVSILMAHFGCWSKELSLWLKEEHDLERPHVFIHGHTHQALLRRDEGILWVNPGAAGRARVGAGPSAGILNVRGLEATGQIISLA